MRVVIGEDSALFRAGLAALLRSAGHEVVAEAADGGTAVRAVVDHRPDVAVLDVRMPPTHTDEGARAAVTIREQVPEQALLLLSQHVETRTSVRLVSQGGFGYLLKDRVLDVDDFLAALARVAAGGSALDPEVVSTLLSSARTGSALAGLTPRETEVLSLMAEGRSNRAIAGRLWLTERTVETHVSSIMTRLGLASSADDHRRVLAVLAWLDASSGAAPRSPRGPLGSGAAP
ncbi:MAG TPA: response regulator transcription factor [Marmoricola sp.]|nr:response regulator transcription factor [Marmoricola sp.]